MKSMTAYASARKSSNSQSVQIILRSLNYRYLDVAIHNLPIENILMEEAIKKEIKKRISRGKIEVFVLAAKPRVKKVSIDADVVAG